MSVALRGYEPGDLETLRTLVGDHSLAGEFDVLQGPKKLEALMVDPFLERETMTLAFADGAPAGFAWAFLLNGRGERWAVFRVGVREPFRRRGVGSALLRAACDALARTDHAPGEWCMAAWQPAPATSAFVAHHGYRHVRTFWLMERGLGSAPAPAWPAGVVPVPFDGSARALEDLNDAYNDSFAEHYHAILSTAEETRALCTRPGFRPDGLMLAYRGATCVGFCRCELHADRGEIAVLGTTHAARAIGLGRALLRWGVDWLERQRTPRVTLLVDGGNEGALRLYRHEGFEVARTRDNWSRAPGRFAG
jgi:mycothiol synthase